MRGKRKGRQTWTFSCVEVLAGAAIAGPKEGRGPLGDRFDIVKDDELMGMRSWEQAEMCLMEEAVRLAVLKAGLRPEQVDFMLAGDLLNQIICCNFTARNLSLPFLGLFAACATFAEALALGSLIIEGGFGGAVLTASCSHNKTAERQYRYPVEQNVQRAPTAHWTVTASGAVLLGLTGGRVRVTHATIGEVVDLGVKNPNDMGSAMAPAAAKTISAHFADTGRSPRDYDLVVTGDLGEFGTALVRELLFEEGIDIMDRLADCGLMIFDEKQDAHAGGSGAGCSASVFAGHLLRELEAGRLNRILLVGTGALFSPTSYQQGESIPCVAHACAVERLEGGKS